MSRTKILMATDVPFWRNETGAQQRMLHLVYGISDDAFGDKACEVQTFFIGVPAPEDEAKAKSLGLDVQFYSSDRAPDGVRKRIKWHMDGTIHLVRQTFRGRADREDVAKVNQPMKLHEFRWPWAVDAFTECVNKFQPEAIIFQYVTMSYLLDGLSEEQRGEIRCVVDTHDVLSSRQDQFEAFGFSHWIDIAPEEESAELQRFDAALAIIDHERPTFQAMAPDADILTISHSLDPITRKHEPIVRQDSDALLSIGYFGSSNHSNGHALIKFVRKVWQPLKDHNADVQLVVAGSICDWLMFHEESRFSGDESMSLWIELSTDPNVTLLGRIDSPLDFYSQIDIAINPVEFGTGLKIKTCEALAYGIPSAITACGEHAIPPEVGDAVFTCGSISEMVPAIFAMSMDRDQVNMMRTSARKVAESFFTNEVCYGELVSWFQKV